MDSLAFLERVNKFDPQPVYVLHGDEDFLKRQVLFALRQRILGSEEAESFGLASHPGDKAIFAEIRDELETLPFLSARRLVLIDNADPFVTRYRSALEKYVGEPAAQGVLVLDVRSWPANTRLAKQVHADATIVAKAPAAHRLPDWCMRWASTQHGKQLVQPAARLLVDLIGSDMGQLDQELAKLSVYVGDGSRIDTVHVDTLVGNSRAENTWKIFDAIASGQSSEALSILGRLLDQGEEPLRILGAFSMQLRRLAQAARLNNHGQSLSAALAEVGIPPFAMKGAEQQLRHLGRQRVDRLYDWLLEVDLGLKGASQLPPGILLERLVVQLARKA